MKLSNYFKYSELTRSSEAIKHGLKNECCKAKAKHLATRLDVFRYILGVPMILTSGYRSPDLNKLVGGVENSAHTKVLAIDFTVNNISVEEAFDRLRSAKVSFDQLIYYPKRNFIHIGFKENITEERKQILVK